jgi:hypothetical protein
LIPKFLATSRTSVLRLRLVAFFVIVVPRAGGDERGGGVIGCLIARHFHLLTHNGMDVDYQYMAQTS